MNRCVRTLFKSRSTQESLHNDLLPEVANTNTLSHIDRLSAEGQRLRLVVQLFWHDAGLPIGYELDCQDTQHYAFLGRTITDFNQWIICFIELRNFNDYDE